jgi:hypothetical protein
MTFLYRGIQVLLFTCFPFSICFGQSANTYTSYSSDGTYIYTGVTVQGSMPPGATNVCHTYSANNVLGGVGGWMQNQKCSTGGGAGGSVTNNQQIWAADGRTVNWNAETKVQCSVAGLFYHQFLPPTTLRIATSSFGLQFQDATGCHYFPTCTATCSGQGAYSRPEGWPDNVCPSFLLCFDLVVTRNGTTCIVSLCLAKTFDPHLCS